MRFGVVGKTQKGGVVAQNEKGVLFLRRVNGYKGIKGRGVADGKMFIRWFEIAEDNPLFAEFVEKPTETWNSVIAAILGGIFEKEGFTREEIMTVSVRLNVKAIVFEFETKERRVFYYEFPQGLRRIVTPNDRFPGGLGQLLRNAEKNDPIEEFPETRNDSIRALFEIREVKAE